MKYAFAFLASALLAIPPLASAITIDGTADLAYGSAIATQALGTSTSKNTETNLATANGTELDAAYGVISNGVLYLVMAGNMDSDLTLFDKLNIFFMTGPGGANTLGTNYSTAADFGHLNHLGTGGAELQDGSPGLTFDPTFAANYWIGATVLTNDIVSVNYIVICSNCPGAFLGNFIPTNASPVLVNATYGIQAALNNSNTNGVDGDSCSTNGTTGALQSVAAAAVRTGLELAIPLTAIGDPTGQVSICAFFTDNLYESMYNQVLGPIWDGSTTYCQGSFGQADTVNFGSLPGKHYFTLQVPPCNAFLPNPASASFNTNGGPGTVTESMVGGCSWSVTSGASWITITAGAGPNTGNGSFSYLVATNTSVNTRTASITVSGQVVTQNVTITQTGATVPPLAGLIVDGTMDPGYGCPVAIQQLSTSYGKNTSTNIMAATGSELDAAYGVIMNNNLFLLLTGNIQANGNRVHIFFMTGPGGQNTLTNVNPNNVDTFSGQSVLNWMGPTNSPTPGAGLTFDPGFAPNYWMDVSATSTQVFFNYAQLWPGGTNALGVATNGYYLGSNGGTNGALIGGTNPYFIQATVNNSNTMGVDGGPTGCHCGCPGTNSVIEATLATNATTGIELGIPLAALGSPTGSIAICAFIGNNGVGLQMSDQILGAFATNSCMVGPGRVANLPYVVLGNYPGQHYFLVGPEMRVTSIAKSGNDINVSYLTEANTNLMYQVQTTSALLKTNTTWTNVGGSQFGTGTTFTQTDSGAATNRPGRFYRVQQTPLCP